MPTKSSKPARARAVRKTGAKALAIPMRKKVVAKAAAKSSGFHINKYAVLAGIAAAAAVSALAFLPESVSEEVKKQVKEKGKLARGDAEKMMKQAIEVARTYASQALH